MKIQIEELIHSPFQVIDYGYLDPVYTVPDKCYPHQN